MDIGVVVGRFQINALHSAHKWLLTEAASKHSTLVVVVGMAPLRGTRRDPLSFALREQMIREFLPAAIVLPLVDNEQDELWSASLDRLLRQTFEKAAFTLYCGRDGFKAAYSGKLPVVELKSQWNGIDSTSIRKAIGETPQYNEQFRAGIIHAIEREYDYARPAVDVAMIRRDRMLGSDWEILLGRKEDEKFWRLPGGMVGREDTSYEAAAKRELFEETGMVVEGSLIPLGSMQVDDWRMRKTGLSCITSLYVAPYASGAPKAGDDICEVKWLELRDCTAKTIFHGHVPLIEKVRQHLEGK